MNNLYANLINEIQKMFSKRKTVAFIAITSLIPLAGAVSISALQNRMGISAVTGARYPMLILGIFTDYLIPLLIFLGAADIFAGEGGDRTLKLTLTRPISRFKIYISKILSIGALAAVNIYIVLIVSILSGLILKDNGSIFTGIIRGTAAYSLSIIPMLVIAVIAAFISQFFKSGSGALTTCIFIYIASKGSPFIFPQVSKLLPFSYTGWHMFWLGNSIMSGKILYVFMLFLSYSIMLLAGGFYFFDRKDI